MGIQIPVDADADAEAEDLTPLSQNWSRILLIGPPNVGKRTILQRLLAMGKSRGLPFSSSGLLCHGWTIDTKYYTVDVCISTASLTDDESNENVKEYIQSANCQALLFIFDLSDASTFKKIQEWVLKMDLTQPEVLLCVGNKADRLPGHFGHSEYRRRLRKRGESSSDPHPEFTDFGIQQSDGSSLLRDDGEPVDDMRSQRVEWCMEHGIEYLEACAVNHLFDQCMSLDGDSQGLSRIWGALSVHMWPGMILKSEEGTLSPPNAEEESSEEGSIVIEYERLSNGSVDLWDNDEGPWSFYESASVEIQEHVVSNNVSNGRSMQTTSQEIYSESNEIDSDATTTSTGLKSSNVTRPDVSGAVLHVKEEGLMTASEDIVIINNRQMDDDSVPERYSGGQVSDTCNRDLEGRERVYDDTVVINNLQMDNDSVPERYSGGQVSDTCNRDVEGRERVYEDTVVINNLQMDNDSVPVDVSGGQVSDNHNRDLEGRERVYEHGRRNQDHSFNDFEGLMSEMARMRDTGRMMSDLQRREMAASLALRMASMFVDEDD